MIVEEILNKHCERHMIRWNLKSFKYSYPRLFRSIMGSMEEVKMESEIKSFEIIKQHCEKLLSEGSNGIDVEALHQWCDIEIHKIKNYETKDNRRNK